MGFLNAVPFHILYYICCEFSYDISLDELSSSSSDKLLSHAVEADIYILVIPIYSFGLSSY